MLILSFEPLSLTLPLSADSHLRVLGVTATLTLTRPCGAVIGQITIPVVAQMCHVIDVGTELAIAQA